ncbi:MAG TPA: UpxY family transcription antiterminator [Blastocatellia bacterium]|nr:UpxY family transcription antiterminator [Blastocatellia bacterium]
MNQVTPWFALKIRSKNEKRVRLLLAQKGYECFLPTYRQKRRWSDRVVEVEVPLFPTYIFCRFSEGALGRAVATPGVTRIVGFGGQPAEVEVKEIEALQLLAQSSLLREPWTYIPNGTLVRIETGPLAGARGRLSSGEDRRRFVISLTLLQRSVMVQLDENTLVSVVEEPKNRKTRIDYRSEISLNLIKRAGSEIV